MNARVKENRSNSKYNPALDKFENSDLFKVQTELIAKKFEGRNILEEIEAIKDKEKITKPQHRLWFTSRPIAMAPHEAKPLFYPKRHPRLPTNEEWTDRSEADAYQN